MSFLRKNTDIFCIFIFTLLIYFCTKNQPLFWDNISQVSVPALHIFNSHFTEIYPPDTVATGHQPFVGLWVAIGWETFGKNLQVSHVMMIPGVFLAFLYLWKLIRIHSIPLVYKIWIFILIAGESVFIAQMSLISFEVFHMAFFLGCVYCILQKKYLGILLFGIALQLVSLRASISGIGLLLFAAFVYLRDRNKTNKKILLSLVPSILVLALFLLHFYSVKHWIVHNTVSGNWSQSSKPADLSLIFKNTLVFIWRLVDNGKLGILLIGFFVFINFKNKAFLYAKHLSFLGILLFQALVFYGVTVISQNSFSNRYILPVSLMGLLTILIFIVRYAKRPKLFLWICSFFILSGHFWIYPQNISNTWDSLLVTRKAFPQLEQVNNFLKKEDIPKNNVGTSFPWKAEEEKKYLIPERLNFINIDTQKNEYILLSNTSNPSNSLLEELNKSKKWKVIFESVNCFTWFRLYRRQIL